jgi:hypothetical protein
MTWIETIKHRNTVRRQIKKSSYGATEISKVMYWVGIRNFRDNGHIIYLNALRLLKWQYFLCIKNYRKY